MAMRHVVRVAVVALAIPLLLLPVRVRAADGAEREFQFAGWLAENGFPDFAERLLDQLLTANPEMKDRSRLVRLQVATARGRFAEAEAILKEMPAGHPKTRAAQLALGNHLYAAGQIDKAKAIYTAFFDQAAETATDDEEVKRFIQDAAYQFAQMLERAGDYEGAVKAYQHILSSNPEATVRNRVKVEAAQLLVKAARAETDEAARKKTLERAKKTLDEVFWDGVSLPFGQAVCVLADIELVRGNPAAAQKAIRDNLDIMKQIDDLLRRGGESLALSPIAHARLLLGELCEGEAKALEEKDPEAAKKKYAEALREFVNVAAKYAESEWSPEAYVHSEDVRAALERLGAKVNVDLGPYKQKIQEVAFRSADTFYRERRYADAIAQYQRMLGKLGGAEGAGRPVANLITAYAHLNDDLAVRAAAAHIAERFASDADAPLGLVMAAKVYFDRGDEAAFRELYERFATDFPNHERTPQVLYNLAGAWQKANDPEKQAQALARIVNGPDRKNEYYLKALHLMAALEHQSERYAEASGHFRTYIQESPPAFPRAQAAFFLADCSMRTGDYTNAAQGFASVAEWLTPVERNPYRRTSEESKKADELIPQARFFEALALGKITEPADRIPALRAQAIERLTAYAAAYPKSDLAPKALHQIGAIYLEQGKTDEATKAFEDLQRRYPESPDGKSAIFAMIRAAIETKKYDAARAAYEKMKGLSVQFTMEQFVYVGQWFLDAERQAEALDAFSFVLQSKTEDRTLLERALYGAGQAQYAMKDFAAAAATLNNLLTRYPNSGLFFEAKLMMGRALREQGRMDEAIAALSDVFKYGTEPVLINRANLDLADIYRGMAAKAKAGGDADLAGEQLRAASAAYQRIVLLSPRRSAALREMVEQAALGGIPTFMEMGKFREAVEMCDTFLAEFPQSTSVQQVRTWRAESMVTASLQAPAPTPAPRK